MRLVTDKSEVFAQLERDVLHNIVLLKHLNPYPHHTRAALLGSDDGMAALVVLDARVSDYDRKAHASGAYVVLIKSDRPTSHLSAMSFARRAAAGTINWRGNPLKPNIRP